MVADPARSGDRAARSPRPTARARPRPSSATAPTRSSRSKRKASSDQDPVPAATAGTGAQEQRQFRAFVQDDATRQVVDQVSASWRSRTPRCTRAASREATRLLGEQRSPRLLVVDISGVELPLSAVNELAEVCEPGVTVIAIGDRNDVGLFRDLINNGVSDYLVKPIAPALMQKSLLNVVESATQGRQNDRRGRLVAVAGARGGVGATMLATGIAWTIANRRRRRVALVDLDLQFGTVALALDLEPSPGPARGAGASGPDRRAVHRPRHDQAVRHALRAQRRGIAGRPGGGRHLLARHPAQGAAQQIPLCRGRPAAAGLAGDAVRRCRTRPIWSWSPTCRWPACATRCGSWRLLPTTNAACQVTVVANRVGEYREGEIARKEFEAAIGRPIDFVIPFDAKSVAAATNVGQPVVEGRGKVADGDPAGHRARAPATPRPAKPRRLRLWPLARR